MDVLNITTIITDLFPEEPDEMVNTASLMMVNAYKTPAKIRGARAMETYSLKMENAVIIKINVMELKNQIWAPDPLLLYRC